MVNVDIGFEEIDTCFLAGEHVSCKTTVSVSEETLERWKRIDLEYQKMQDEMKELLNV
jgi:hypothetical protein